MWDEIKNSVLDLCIGLKTSHLRDISMELLGRQLVICLECRRKIWDREILMGVIKEICGIYHFLKI